MSRKVVLAGLLGGVVLVVWTFVVNGLFGLQARVDMKRIPAEREVYETLKANVTEPGRYLCNPALTEQGRFPDGEPVFSVLYGGVGHEAAGRGAIVGLVLFLLAPTLAAWLLSHASERVLASYGRKVLFFASIGALIAVFSDLPESGIGSYPAGDALIRALGHVAAWTIIGLAVSRFVRPERI